jgi:hypothetical protein
MLTWHRWSIIAVRRHTDYWLGCPMNEFFTQRDKIVRCLGSGLVALVAAHLFNSNAMKQLNMRLGASDTWWPVVWVAPDQAYAGDILAACG